VNDIEQDRLGRLLNRFGRAAQAHFEALENMDAEAANRHAVVIARIYVGIVADEAGAELLLTLLADPRPAVRGMAAIYTLRHNTARSLSVLQDLALLPGLMGFRASCAIERWEKGELENNDAS
jgi:hypothetical protein